MLSPRANPALPPAKTWLVAPGRRYPDVAAMLAVPQSRPADRAATLADRLAALAERAPGRIVFTTSLGLEDQALTHAVVAAGLVAELVTLDTGRLFDETYQLWAETEARYGIRIASVHPDAEAVAALVAADGPMGFRDGVAARKACCGVRKVEPLGRALAGADAWLTGLRGERGSGGAVETLAWDEARGLWKASPLADWSREEVADYCAAHDVPISPLHAKGFLSIGCAPCTRAVLPGEDERAGRWWWEQGDSRECGLHVSPDGRLVRSKVPA